MYNFFQCFSVHSNTKYLPIQHLVNSQQMMYFISKYHATLNIPLKNVKLIDRKIKNE